MDIQKKQYVHLVFLFQDSVVLLTNKNQQLGFPSSRLSELDGTSHVCAAARIIIQKLNNADIRLFSFNQNYQSVINWQAYEKEFTNINNLKVQENQIFYNPQLYMWSEYFQFCPLWNDDSERNFIYLIHLNQQDLELFSFSYKLVSLKEIGESKLKAKSQHLIDQINLIDMIMCKKYVPIHQTFVFIGFKTEESDKFTPLKPFLHTSALFLGNYKRRNEEWVIFNAPKNEFPCEELLSRTKAILLSGSACSSYDEFDWIRTTERFLCNAYKNHKQLKILGICFGMQVLIQALGGKVEPMEGRKLDKKYYLFGNETIHLDVGRLQEFPQLGKMNIISEATINVAHGDEVTMFPEILMNVGWSQSCKNEILVSKDFRILCYQCHPEYSSVQYPIFVGIYLALIQSKLYKDVMHDLMNKFGQPNHSIHLEICNQFIKS